MNFENPKLEKIENNEREIIKFPQSLNQIRELQNKLKEYKQRPDSLDRDYKVAVLEKLLTKGEVDKNSLSVELKERFGSLDAVTFKNAFGVIKDYVETGGQFVLNGSGLKLEHQEFPDKLIKDAEGFEELYEIIKSMGGVRGSQEYFTPQKLKSIIDGVIKGELPLTAIARADGLRDKVKELLDKKFSKEIKDIQSFEELYEVLKSKNGLDGTSRHYSAEELIEKIENYRKYGFGVILREITRAEGLRDKVEELLKN